MNNNNNDEVIELDLLHIFSLLYHKIWIIILVALTFGIGGFCYGEFYITPTYQSSALFYVNNKLSIGSTSVSVSSADISASQSLVDTYIVILKTRNTLESVIDKGGFNLTYGQLSSKISASSVNSTEVFRVTVTDTNPQRACSIANTIAEILPDKISEIVSGSSAKVVDYAVVEPYKVGSSASRYTMIAAAVGGLLTCAIIVLRDILDDTINSDEFLLSSYENIPVLAAIPNLRKQDNYYYDNYYKSKYGNQKYAKGKGNPYEEK